MISIRIPILFGFAVMVLFVLTGAQDVRLLLYIDIWYKIALNGILNYTIYFIYRMTTMKVSGWSEALEVPELVAAVENLFARPRVSVEFIALIPIVKIVKLKKLEMEPWTCIATMEVIPTDMLAVLLIVDKYRVLPEMDML